MNDKQIRLNFHQKRLRRHHVDQDSLVVDELGLRHGKCRADIAVINGHFIGYEIKSDKDTLRRLEEQVETYSAVFDRATVIVGPDHVKGISKHIPHCWGIIAAKEGPRGGIHFETVRRAEKNREVDDFTVAQLLWRIEVVAELAERGVSGSILRQKRSILYRELVNILDAQELRIIVRKCLKNRINWRCPEQLSLDDDWSRPYAK